MSFQMNWGWDCAWWETEKGDERLASRLMSTVRDIEIAQSSIFTGNARHAKLYAGYLPVGLNWTTGPGFNQRAPFAATKALVRSICDTATALITRFRPRSSFITTQADWSVQKQAEDMELFLGGAFERGGVYHVSPRSFLDTTVFGTGGWKYIEKTAGDDYHVKVERVLPDDLVIDETECRDTLDPDNVYHRVLVRADGLARKYAPGDSQRDRKVRDLIKAAANISNWPNRGVPRDHCIVVDATNLSSGRRVVAIEGCVLSDVKWAHPWHPYTFLWWVQPISGFYGDGVAYRQFGRQERISFLYRWIERCQTLFGTPTAWVPSLGGPPTFQMSNQIGAIVQSAKPPVFQVHQAVPPEIYAWVDKLAEGGYEDEGISQASAGNHLPAGVDSAPAQREYSFKEANRFAPVSQRWESAIAVDTAVKMIGFYRARAQKAGPPTMKWADRGFLQRVEWPDLAEDAYLIRPAASSLESLSPAARMQAAIELSQTSWLRPGEGRKLLGHPDLEAADALDNAPTNYAMKVLKRLLKQEWVDVDEYADLVVLDSTVRRGRLDAIYRGAPDHVIDHMSDYLDRLDRVISDANAAMAAGQQVGVTSSAGDIGKAAAEGNPIPFAGGQG